MKNKEGREKAQKVKKNRRLALTSCLHSFIEKPGHHFSRPVVSTAHPPLPKRKK
jgi:hypothetical protein